MNASQISHLTRLYADARAFNKTTPWSDSEMLIVNGQRLVYVWGSNDMIVVFPGGRKEPLSSVQSWAHVRLPVRIRSWRAHSRN